MYSKNSIQDKTTDHLQALTHWAAHCSAGNIPREVYTKAALVLFDDLAAIVSAGSDPVIIKLIDQLRRLENRPEATVYCADNYRTDRYNAAWANGAAAPWNELDEGSLRVSCHSGIYVIPALLAEAEVKGLKGGQLLHALIIGYEVVTRIASCFQQSELRIHPHAAFATIGACAGIAAARNYDENQFLSILTAASTTVNPGPFKHAVGGSFMRNMWVANASWTGLKLADWIKAGVSGLPQSLFQVYTEIFGFDCWPGELTENLGIDWALLSNFQKVYPCCQFAHSTIEAISTLTSSLPEYIKLVMCSQLKEIRVQVHEKGRLLDEYEPVNILAARFSLPHIIAVMVVHGVIDTNSLSVSSLSDPEVTKIRKLVRISALQTVQPSPNDRASHVRFIFNDGEEFEAECLCARGSQSKPLALEVLKGKIRNITADAYPRMQSVMDRFLELDEDTLNLSWEQLLSLMSEQLPDSVC